MGKLIFAYNSYTMCLYQKNKGCIMERLDKVLSNLGYGTRKDLKKIVRSGLVEVNGVLAKDSGMQVDPEKDKIIINGEEIF